MNSSLLPNDIQDIDGLELKEQVKVLKDYIEYMREQLQWFSSVTDKNEEGFVQSVTTYYGVSTSQTTPPSQWSTEAPVVSDGEYLWQYTKTTRSGVTTRSEPVCISSSFTAGEDAALVYIHSSNGNVFHAGNTGTVLTVTVYYGSDAIRTLSNLQTAFGSGAHLAWYVKEYGESTYDPVSPSDPRLSDNGFTFTLDADDVDTKASYNCRLMLSSTVTRSQSSITITDVDDGYTSVLSQESVTWNGNDTNLGSNKTVSFSVSGYCGPDTAPFTIGTPVLSDTTNASASVSGSTVTLSVSSAATTGGTVTLPVIFTDGPTLHNTFSYFVVLKGAQGIQGDQGDQGIQGPAGPDGRTTYVHIKYSHIANPQTSADISDTPDDYIGICTNYTSSDPTDPAAYAPWTRFVGEDGPQGIPGETGEDGTTYYVHFAYGTSDQGADFSVTPFEGATYIGVCTDENELDPVTPASYTWSLTKGEKGDAGYNAATIFLYQRKSSVPNKQAGTLTYTFATKALTGTLDNGWSTSIPSGTNPLYVIIATASSNTATDTIVSADWSSPVILAQDGGAGKGISSVTEVYFAKANTTAPSAPSSTVTTNDPTVYNAWNKALPTYSSSYPYYFTCSEVLLSDGSRVWSTPVYAGALTTANQTAASANSTAATANSTANAANTTANAANTTANAASTTAAAAQTTANTANTTANTAKTTANTAKATADATKEELDNLSIGGRNYAITCYGAISIGTTETRGSGVTAKLTGPATWTMNGSATTADWFFSSSKVFGGVALEPGTYACWGINPENVFLRVGKGSSATYFIELALGSKSTPYLLTISQKDIYWFTPRSQSGKTFSNQETKLMIERGNRATDWTPAPEDVDAAIETAEDTAIEALNKHGFCSCSTAAGTAAKTASLTGFQLKTGSTVHVTFTNANTVANPTLNINSTGAKAIKWNNAAVAASPSPWAAGECVAFVYDGTNWVISGQSNISADNIVAGSIAADRIKANVISAVNGGTGSINADKMQTNVITAVNAGVGTINAEKIAVEVGGRNLIRRTDYSIYGSGSYTNGSQATFASDRITIPYGKEVYQNSYASNKLTTVIPSGTVITCSVYVYSQTITNGSHRLYVSILRSNDSVLWQNIKDIPSGFSGKLTWQYTLTEDAYGFVLDFDTRNSTSGQMVLGRVKAELGNRATDWTPAPEDVEAGISNAAKTATSYITNISGGGITVTGNSASSKIEIASTVKVIKDSTHFTEMTASDFYVYAGNATYPAARLAQNGAYLSGDGAGVYLARILKAAFIDAQTTYGGMFELNNTSGGVGVRIYAGPSYGTQLFYNASDKMLLRVGANETGQGEVSVFKATSSASTIAAKIGTLTVTSGGQTLVNNEPTLAFYDNGTMRSWYSLKRAFINDGNHQGYVVYGYTAAHGITVDYLTSGRINFYVDTTSIGYATIISSDERMKTDIEPIDDKYKRAAGSVELKNFRFDFNDPTRAGANLLKRFGAIAQDVIKALDDEGINYEENELVETLEDDDGEYYTINYVPFLIARLAADEDRINELTTRLEALERR